MIFLPLIVPHLQHVKSEKGSDGPMYKLINTPLPLPPLHPPLITTCLGCYFFPPPALHRHSICRYNSRRYIYTPLCTSNSTAGRPHRLLTGNEMTIMQTCGQVCSSHTYCLRLPFPHCMTTSYHRPCPQVVRNQHRPRSQVVRNQQVQLWQFLVAALKCPCRKEDQTY